MHGTCNESYIKQVHMHVTYVQINTIMMPSNVCCILLFEEEEEEEVKQKLLYDIIRTCASALQCGFAGNLSELLLQEINHTLYGNPSFPM